MSYPNSAIGDGADSPLESGYGGGSGLPAALVASFGNNQQQPSLVGGGGRSPLRSHHNESFQLPPRNPVLESFVNDTQGIYTDPGAALSAAESRCVGLVASAESFAQMRHAKLQQLFKRIQSANNEEISDLTGRVGICESALQELAGLLEHVQMHISSASSATHEFIRTCTTERGKAEGRLLASMNSMLVRYEQQRRHWRQAAAQLLIRQDTEGMRAELDTLFSGLGMIVVQQQQQQQHNNDDYNRDRNDSSFNPFDELESDDEDDGRVDVVDVAGALNIISTTGPHVGFLSVEEQALQRNCSKENNSNSNNNAEPAPDRSNDDDSAKTPLRQVQRINNNNNNNNNVTRISNKKNNRNAADKQQATANRLLKYLPAAVRERRRSILNNFSAVLSQMLIDGDSVDRPFLLDATYARLIRTADLLSLHGEVICRYVAEMFRAENKRRTHTLLSREREIFRRNAVAMCPPNLVAIGDEPVYTVFVQRLVEHRLEREVKILTMMDSGLDEGKKATRDALDASAARYRDAVMRILATVTKHGIMMLQAQKTADHLGSGDVVLDGTSALSALQQQQQQGADGSSILPSSVSIGAPLSRIARGRVAAAQSLFPNNNNNNNNINGSSGSGNNSISFAGVTGALRHGGGGSSSGHGAASTAVSVLVARLLTAVSSSDAPPEPGSSEQAIHSSEARAMERVFARLLTEVTESIQEHQHTLTTAFNETIAAVQPSPINLISNPTVFSLEALQSELAHQALLLKVASSNEGTERGRLMKQLNEERTRSNALMHDNAEMARKIIVLEAEKQQRAAEVSEMEATVAARRKSDLNLRQEVRRINYAVTADAFGRGWQESVLLLRESMMRQMSLEQQRLLAKVKAYQRRKFDDQTRVVELLERGFVATADSLEADSAARLQQQRVRHEVEIQRLRDECNLRVRNVHLDAQEETRRNKEMYESLYKDRVADLNQAYEEKTRQIEMRQRDWEDRLWSKMRQIRADFREKEVQIEQQYAKKHEAVLRIYEDEAKMLKKNVSDKEALLESERLSVHLEIEKQISDGVNKVKAQHEQVRNELQATMLQYLQGQRELFDQQRNEEMSMFSTFAFGGMQFAKDTAFEIVDANRRNFQQQIDASQHNIQDATLSANDVTGRLLRHRDDLHDSRLKAIRENNEQVLRRTQLLRVEQDEKTWNHLHREIVKKGGELDKKQMQVETLMTQRYIDIVQTLHRYIQGDVSAAHQSFERECNIRQDQLRRYLNHFHTISLRVESELWRETSQRNDIEREAISMQQLLMNRSRTEAEYVVRNSIINAHISSLNSDAEETTFITVESLRARYEGLLRRQHQLMGAMSHDYVAALQHYVAQSSHAQDVMSSLFSSRMDELHSSMRDKWQVHWSSRDMIVEKKLEQLVRVAATACKELLGGALILPSSTSATSNVGGSPTTSPSLVHSNTNSPTRRRPTSPSSSRVVVLEDGATTTFDRHHHHHHPHHSSSIAQLQQQQQQLAPPLFFAQNVRVAEYFTAVRQLLSKTFTELESTILHGQEEREKRQTQHAIAMRTRFLEAASALTRRAEQLEDKVLQVTMDKNLLHAQLQMKTEAEVRAATLADDLKALVGHYRLLTQNVLVHGAFCDVGGTAADLFFSRAGGGGGGGVSGNSSSRFLGASGIIPGGTFKRTHLLQRQTTNVPSQFFGVHGAKKPHQQQQQHQQQAFGIPAASGGYNDSTAVADDEQQESDQRQQPQQNQQQFQAMFLIDVGGKKATRDVVMENAALRERLMATEWRNDKFLKDAIMSGIDGSG